MHLQNQLQLHSTIAALLPSFPFGLLPYPPRHFPKILWHPSPPRQSTSPAFLRGWSSESKARFLTQKSYPSTHGFCIPLALPPALSAWVGSCWVIWVAPTDGHAATLPTHSCSRNLGNCTVQPWSIGRFTTETWMCLLECLFSARFPKRDCTRGGKKGRKVDKIRHVNPSILSKCALSLHYGSHGSMFKHVQVSRHEIINNFRRCKRRRANLWCIGCIGISSWNCRGFKSTKFSSQKASIARLAMVAGGSIGICKHKVEYSETAPTMSKNSG